MRDGDADDARTKARLLEARREARSGTARSERDDDDIGLGQHAVADLQNELACGIDVAERADDVRASERNEVDVLAKMRGDDGRSERPCGSGVRAEPMSERDRKVRPS